MMADDVTLKTQQTEGPILLYLNDLHPLHFKNVYMDIRFGDAMLRGVDSESVTVEVNRGDIRMTNVSGSKLLLNAQKGDIKLLSKGDLQVKKREHGRPYLDAISNEGDIDLRGIQSVEDTDITVITRKGSIQLGTRDFKGTFKLENESGKLEVHGDVKYQVNDSHLKEGSFKEGNSTLYAKTWKGDISASFK